MEQWVLIEKIHEKRVDNTPEIRDNIPELMREEPLLDFAITGQIKNKAVVHCYVLMLIKELGIEVKIVERGAPSGLHSFGAFPPPSEGQFAKLYQHHQFHY